jgi:transposase-like protein
MALKVMSVTDLRLEVLREASQSGETVTAVCRRFGISRETYYVYLRRFRAEGIEGLEPRSTVPLRQPQRMPADVEAVICALRKEHPKWGARRIRAELRREGIGPPAVSSIHRALSRNNLVAPGGLGPGPPPSVSSGPRPTICGRSTPPGSSSPTSPRSGSWTSSTTMPAFVWPLGSTPARPQWLRSNPSSGPSSVMASRPRCSATFKLIVPLDPPFVRPAAESSEVTGARSALLLTDRSV